MLLDMISAKAAKAPELDEIPSNVLEDPPNSIRYTDKYNDIYFQMKVETKARIKYSVRLNTLFKNVWKNDLEISR